MTPLVYFGAGQKKYIFRSKKKLSPRNSRLTQTKTKKKTKHARHKRSSRNLKTCLAVFGDDTLLDIHIKSTFHFYRVAWTSTNVNRHCLKESNPGVFYPALMQGRLQCIDDQRWREKLTEQCFCVGWLVRGNNWRAYTCMRIPCRTKVCFTSSKLSR